MYYKKRTKKQYIFLYFYLHFAISQVFGNRITFFLQQSELDPRMSDAAEFWEINGVKFNAEATTLHLDVCV